MRTVNLQYEYQLPKKAVFEWWTDLSGRGYVGHSLKSLKPIGKEGDKILVETKWKAMGMERTMVEKLSFVSDDHWIWEPAEMMGIRVTDDFSLHELPGRATQLRIRSEWRPTGLKGKFVNLTMGRMLARSFVKEWNRASEACNTETAGQQCRPLFQ